MRGGYDIVAAITRALALRLQDAVNQVGGSLAQTQVTTRRPSAADTGQTAQINLCLFHVLPNPYLRNLHEPWRMEGRQVEQPVTALDLYYLISFIGPEHMDQLDPQRLLGITANALNLRPALSPRDLDAAGAAAMSATAPVEITPHSLSIEELSRLWSMFASVPYQLSVCYRVSAALVVADVVLQPRPPSGGDVAPRAAASPPVSIRAVAAEDGGPVVYGAAMLMHGATFASDLTLSLGEVALPMTRVSPDAIAFTLEGMELRAGPGQLRLARAGTAVASVPLALGPSLVASRSHLREERAGFSGRIAVTLHPPVQPGQSVELDLFPVEGGEGLGFRTVKPVDGRAAASLDVPVSAVPAGRYALLATVDGTPGRLARDAAGAYRGPFVNVRAGRAA